MRILWVSDLGVSTGFARVSHSIIRHIKDRVDITGFGINYKGNPHNVGIDIYPAAVGPQDVMGFSKIATTIEQGNYDAIFILQDVWVQANYLAEIKKHVPEDKIPPIVSYFPVDAEEHDSSWYNDFNIVTKAVAYTEFGKKVAEEATKNIELLILPHGNDDDIFYKKYGSRKEAREIMSPDSKIKNFVVLNANRNQPRKRLDITLRGFKIFAEGKEDVALHMHCGVTDASIDVAKLAIRLGIDDKIVLTNLNHGPQSVSEEDLNLFYNAADVGLNSGMGEGWGLTATEHAMTGAVQIVPDHSACAELFHDVGILVPTVAEYTFNGIMTVGKLVSPEGIAAALEEAYQNRNSTEKADAAIAKFSGDYYNWKHIAEKWFTIFEEVTK